MQFVNSENELYDRWRKLLKIYVIENFHDEVKDDERKFKNDSTFILRTQLDIEESVRFDLIETMNESYQCP